MTSLIGGVLGVALVLLGLRLMVGLDDRRSAAGRLGGLVAVALLAPPCAAVVTTTSFNFSGCQNNLGNDTGMVGVVAACIVVGAVVLAGVLQYIAHRRRLDAWLRRQPTSRKRRVEKA